MTLTRRTYNRLYGATLVHAPDVLAWRCGVCRLVIFDQPAVDRIELVVGQAGPPPNIAAARPARPAEPSSTDQTSLEDQPDGPPRPAQP